MIEGYSFGQMKIKGVTYTSDLKIIDTKIYPNWWRKEGHRLYPEDIADILEARPEILIVGTGAYGAMILSSEVTKALDEHSIRFEALPTAKAAERFNQLMAEKKRVAGAFHLTC
ncbi:Mth938-like domain-containing protein [Thermosulfuriphilus sp.]